jgi:hypothetical protein
MSLDVIIKNGAGADVEAVLSLRHDGYYAWLHPWFAALATETGLYIDLYGAADFRGEDLTRLERTLQEALTQLEDQPERWEVVTGISRSRTASWEVRHGVERRLMEELLNHLLTAVERARRMNGVLSFFGD